MPQPVLVVRDRAGERSVALSGTVTAVGRSRTCQIQLDAEGVSRAHCEIVASEGEWHLVDQGSHNGTRVNGVRVQEKVLEPGDTIEVGRATMVFRIETEAAPRPAPRDGGPDTAPTFKVPSPAARTPVFEKTRPGVVTGTGRPVGATTAPLSVPEGALLPLDLDWVLEPDPTRRLALAMKALAQARSDPATGLLARGFFDRVFPELLARHQAAREPIAVVRIELDRAAAAPAAGAGPAAADAGPDAGGGAPVPPQVVQALRAACTPHVLPVHLGNGEVLLCLPGHGAVGGQELAAAVRASLRGAAGDRAGAPAVTASAGIAAFEGGTPDPAAAPAAAAAPPGTAPAPAAALGPEELLRRADQALAEAQRAGGDRAVVWDERLAAAPGRQDTFRAMVSGDPARDLKNVAALLDIIQAGTSGDNLTALVLLTLDRVLEITGTERGMLILDEDGGSRITAARDRAGRTLEAFSDVSQSLLKQVRETCVPAFRMETGDEPGAGPTYSMVQLQLRAVLCVPLRAGGRVLGVLYVDSHGASRRFTPADLRFLDAIGRHVAVVLDNFRLAERKERRHESHRRRLEAENASLRESLGRRDQVLGESEGMKAVYDTVRKAAPTDVTCLILGESGTGKEALAHTLHNLSPRAAGPFVIVDCGAIPETLIESELFGHEKGSFTGAVARKIGKFEEADRGTIFLDEVGELPLAMQVKLLRVLQEREFTRVGGLERIRVDVRFVAATNADLEAAVRAERFRPDLYHRLCVVALKVPPLRERERDVVLLARHFLERYALEHDRPARGFTAEAADALLRHRWPGNVRELQHRIEQAVILSDREELTPENLQLKSDLPLAPTLEIARDRFEAEYLKAALARNGGNVTHTARALGISRQHLQTLMKKHALARDTTATE